MAPKNKLSKWLLLILIAVMAITIYQRINKDGIGKGSDNPTLSEGLTPAIRKNARLIYSKHARCRMDCRQINESEVRDILENGRMNRTKSELSRDNPRYALEGITNDGQRVRIVFAKDEKTLVVVTCIDLEKEWSCNCN